MTTVFDDIDAHPPRLGPFGLHAVTDPEGVRRKVLFLAVAAALMWVILGFDSTWEQVTPIERALLENPSLLTGLLDPASQIRVEMAALYGVGDHWSAFVIYGFAYIFLSRRIEADGIKGSLNFFASSCLTLLNVGVFETMWNRSYGYFQGQPWVYTVTMSNVKQTQNLLFFASFLVIGVIVLLMLGEWGYKLRLDRLSVYLVAASAMCFIAWVYWPLPTQRIVVGGWVSSPLFPQTYYAVIPPGGSVASPHYVSNDLLHLWNTFTKLIWASAVTYICSVGRRDV